MAAFLFALLAALVAGVGARDQMLVAWMAERRGSGIGLLVTMLAAALLSAALAGWAGTIAAPQLALPVRKVLVAMALGLAALELIVLRPGRRPAEPTASLGALAIVVLAQEVTDAARLLVFALAASSSEPHFAVLGGMLGCAGTVAIGWGGGEALARLPLGHLRAGLGVLLAGIAAYLVV